MKKTSINIELLQVVCSALLICLFSCSPRIAGYTKGECIKDPGTGICRPVCAWKLVYVIKNKRDCMRAKYNCPGGQRVFGTKKGCGCAEPVFCRPVQ